MQITYKEWQKYLGLLEKLDKKAKIEFIQFNSKKGGFNNYDRYEMLDFIYALTTKYGEASATISAQLYDEIALASGKILPPAIPAETMTYKEVAKTVNGAMKFSPTEDYISGVVGQIIKQASADTTLQNAKRDSAEFAWIPSGDTCVFCLSIASNGWKRATKETMQGNHADHIHPNCTCEFCVRFDRSTNVQGYNPNKYKDMYDNAEGRTSKDKINYLRREQYAENKDEINEQKRIAYASRKEREEETTE